MLCGDARGTPKGARRHIRGREPMCPPCHEADKAYHREWTRKRRAQLRVERDRITVPSVIVDVLVTEARWLPSDVLVDLVRERHPEFKESSVFRALWRLSSDGVLESRTFVNSVYDGALRTRERCEFRADDEAWEALYVA